MQMAKSSFSHGSRPHVVIAGQMPPPVGGQNINIKRVFELLGREDDLKVSHLEFQFTKEWSGMRRASVSKVLELFRVIGRALRLRGRAPIDFLLYPAGGPHTVAIIRDWLLIPFLALLSRRVVVHFRAAGLAERLERSSGWFRLMCRFVYGVCASEAVVLAPFGKRDAAAVGLERVTVVPNAFEDRAGDGYRRESRQGEIILSVGHLCADKGVPQLIEAFGRVAPDFPDSSLVLVGEPLGPYSEEQLRIDIAATGIAERIEWKGLLNGEDLAESYREGDLFVFSSVAPYESFGMVMIEAMQWSLPIIVTDWRANVSVCGDGFGGVVAREPEKDLVMTLEETLREVLPRRSEWEEWGQRNRKIYEERYTLERLRGNLRALIGGKRR